MDLLAKLLEHHVWLVGEIVDRAGRLPADRLDAPITVSVEGVDDDPTLRSLLSRLVGQMDMWNAAMENRAYDFEVERGESLRSIRARLDSAGPAFLAQANEVIDESRLDETFVDATCDPPQVFTYGGMLGHVLTFAAHRRTLAIGALHSAGHHRPRGGRPDAVGRGGGVASGYSGSAAAASRAMSTSGCTKKNEPIVTTSAAPTAASSRRSRRGEPPAATTPSGSSSPWRMKSARTMLR